MGKTQGGAVWLDAAKTSPYDFYQYWRNVEDSNVVRLLKMLTFIPLDEIGEMAEWQGSGLNRAKERLAYEVTRMVHGKDEADKAQAAAKALFAAGSAGGDMPATGLSAVDFHDGSITTAELLVPCGLAPSSGEATRIVSKGGARVGEEKITALDGVFSPADFEREFILRKGKKIFHKVTFKK